MTIKELKNNIELIAECYDNVEIKDIWMNDDKLTIELKDIEINGENENGKNTKN